MTQAPITGTPGLHPLTAVATPGRFERAFNLAVATDGLADSAQADGALTRLSGSFQARTYDALAAAPPLRLSFATGDDGQSVVVMLPAPLRLAQVRVTAAGQAPDHLTLHRVDGTVLADKSVATLTRVPGQRRYNAPAGLEVARFALRRCAGGSCTPLLQGAVAAVDVMADPLNPSLAVQLAGRPGTRVPLWSGAVEGAASFDVGARLGEEVQRLLDELPAPLPAGVAFEVVAAADAPCRVQFSQGALAYRLAARRFAALPLRRSDVADPAALLAALRHPTEPVIAHLRSRLPTATLERLDGGRSAALAQGGVLDAVLAGVSAELAATPLWDPDRFAGVALPPEVAALVGPTPTGPRLHLVNRLLLEAARADLLRPSDGRRVLDVEPSAPAPVVAAPRPVASAVQGRLEVLPSVRPVRHAAKAVVGPPVSGAVGVGVLGEAQAGGAVGVAVPAERWVAAPLRPAGPVRAAGIDIAVLAQAAGTELEVVLRKDHRDRPDGAVLRHGTASAPAAGAPSWARLDLDEPLVLQPEPTWVAVRAVTGAAVWLAGGEVTSPAAVFTREVAATSWHAAPVGPLPLAVRVVADWSGEPPAVAACAGGAYLADPDEAGGRLVFDLGGALAAAPAGSSVRVSLRAAGRGQLIVYPPTVTYDL